MKVYQKSRVIIKPEVNQKRPIGVGRFHILENGVRFNHEYGLLVAV